MNVFCLTSNIIIAVTLVVKILHGLFQNPRIFNYVKFYYCATIACVWASLCFKLVITKGYGVRATMIEGQNAFAPSLCFAEVSRDSCQNTCDQITSDRKSKCTWSNCVLCIPFTLSGSPNKCLRHICGACVIKTWRLPAKTVIIIIIVFVKSCLLHVQNVC